MAEFSTRAPNNGAPHLIATRNSTSGYSVSKKFADRARANRYKHYLNAIAELSGEPEPLNPFKELRTNAQLTLVQLVDKTGLTKQALIRTEQGIYPEPPDRLLDFWTKEGNSYPELRNNYESWQMTIRSRHDRLFLWPRTWDQRVHPLMQLAELWRNPFTDLPYSGEPMNPTELSKLLCVSQAVVNHWLKHPIQQKSVPTPLWVALSASGYSKKELAQLSEAYYKFRCYKLGKAPIEGESSNVVNLDTFRSQSGRANG